MTSSDRTQDNPQGTADKAKSKQIKNKQEMPKTEDYLSKLQHLQADFENYKKYIEKQQAELAKCANKALICDILPILDDLDAASHEEGLRLLRDKLLKLLEAHGLKRIDTDGVFNPLYHEAILAEQSDKAEGHILAEIRAGYTLNNLVIRASQVKISKKAEVKKHG